MKTKAVESTAISVQVWLQLLGRGPRLEGAGTMSGTRGVFQDCGFRHHRFCTEIVGYCAERDFRSLLLWFPEITFPPRGILVLPPLFPGDSWGPAGAWDGRRRCWPAGLKLAV